MKNKKKVRLLAALVALMSLMLFTGSHHGDSCSECDELFENPKCTIRIVNFKDVETLPGGYLIVTLFNSNTTIINPGLNSEFITTTFDSGSPDVKEFDIIPGYIVWHVYYMDGIERKTLASGYITTEKGETKTIKIR